ncbi:hypothetical protein LXA43DRAFT_1040441, partial [Ganoderma leucocontextum]
MLSVNNVTALASQYSHNSMLDTLIAYAVCTRTVFNILGFAFALRSPNKLIYAAFNIEVAKIYTNSVLSAATYEVRDVLDFRVAPIGSSTVPGSFGNVYQSKTPPRPGEAAFGPLNSVIEINVPGHFYQETTMTTSASHNHGHADDVATGRMSVNEKEHEHVCTAYTYYGTRRDAPGITTLVRALLFNTVSLGIPEAEEWSFLA